MLRVYFVVPNKKFKMINTNNENFKENLLLPNYYIIKINKPKNTKKQLN